MSAMQRLPLSELFFRERTIMENQILNSNIEALNKFECSKFETLLRVYVENSLDLMRAWRRDIPRKHAHYAPAATFARVRLRNFCLTAKDRASLPHDGLLRDIPTPCSSLLSKVRDTSFLFRVENFELRMHGGQN